MKLLLVAAALIAVVAARPQKPGEAVILEQSIDNDGLGQYTFGFKTSDGLIRQEQGVVKNQGTENEALEVRGTITWKGADGKDYSINFIADENGFQPQYTQ
ncbi:endocuticle structural protein SgAbd-6 [Schistocerca americana]|nr:endocuticle structural protein SgAbd-6 [Schistocerca americana]XP_047097839.1 endocuticle structural protein SgAbd-6 [Schistocerca piceifrons]XP_049767574.1 endocuticle structural protein SgAbd-6 [Schistocerca cancellata]XP_049941386.1 endocuticle structural protein SgAbd-6 [Schistocerca serialis cubense]